jgi:glycosyltransferase involved in cell wall biosynthesis
VIGTRKASLPEYLGDLGIYVEEDSPEQLAECMIDLMDHPEAVISLGQRLRQRAGERFSWDRVAGDVLRIYEEVASACS